MRRQFARGRMTQVREDGSALLPPVSDGSEEAARSQGLLNTGLCHVFFLRIGGCLCSRLSGPVFVSFVATIVIRHLEVC